MKLVGYIRRLVLTLCAAAALWGATTSSALAYCTCCTCVCPYMCCNRVVTKIYIVQAFEEYRQTFIFQSFHQNQFENDGVKMMTDSIRDSLVNSALMIGAFLDGYAANFALAELQSLNAQTINNYAVSDSICKFGTLSRSLAATEAKMTTQQMVLSEIGLARNLGTQNSMAATGRGRDNQSRLHSFVAYYCDQADNNRGLDAICKPASGATAPRDVEYNRDIDFTRTLDDKATLNIDLTDDTLTRDENAVIALGNLVYGHRQDTERVSPMSIKEDQGAVDRYALVRSIVARRAAAQNSYDAIVSMKSGGSGASRPYMEKVLSRLGLSDKEIERYIQGSYIGSPQAGNNYDDKKEPSYYAQMEILTKRLYQDPVFYGNLMDSKANVKRISASLDALDLAQTRDIYKSQIRSEMLMALLLDLQTRERSDEVGGNFSTEIRQ